MSLTSGIHCPRTPLRRFLDRELSAGARPLRKSFRARDQSDQILLPGPGVGTEAGNVGTAIATGCAWPTGSARTPTSPSTDCCSTSRAPGPPAHSARAKRGS
ncbi:hypothetical protein ACWFR5_38560 [Streptomyces sp. NPDC055092]